MGERERERKRKEERRKRKEEERKKERGREKERGRKRERGKKKEEEREKERKRKREEDKIAKKKVFRKIPTGLCLKKRERENPTFRVCGRHVRSYVICDRPVFNLYFILHFRIFEQN